MGRLERLTERLKLKFGIFTHVPWPEGRNPKQLLEEATEQAVVAEELGYYSYWLAEHHFSRYGIGSSSLVLASNIAARTKKIRLGTAVLVPPLHHPIKLAEDGATLDLISGGRFDAGFGRGTAGYEYAGYHVNREESQIRFQESIKIIQGLWTTPDFSFSGQHYQVNHANLVPMPEQKPHPPIYIAATRTPETLEFAISTGHPMMTGVVLDHDDATDLCQRFVALSEQAGHRVPLSEVPFFRYCYVAETKEQARREAEPAMCWTQDMLQWRRQFTEGSEVYQKLDDFRRTRTEQPPSYDYLAEKRAIIGTPEQCVARIKEFQNLGIEYFGCNFDFGGMEQKTVLKCMELFAREVMPHFC